MRVDDSDWQEVRSLRPHSRRGRDYFWMSAASGLLDATVQAYDGDGKVTGEFYAACLSG